MNKVIEDFLHRNLPRFQSSFDTNITGENSDSFTITTSDGIVHVTANNTIMAIHAIYSYLKKYCHVNLSWCGNRTIDIDELVMFDGEYKKTVVEKWRVYMNYCTLDYSMAWWDFDRWEKEIDFMAMNGINMPLGVIGSEAVWYETLLEYGFTRDEALSTVSGPAFWAWHLMTNIESYLPPQDESYIYERLELGRKILARYRELGMTPIMQGFSGHVPMKAIEKYPSARILKKCGWNGFTATAQLDPLDPLFAKMGMTYLRTMDRLLGNSHYIACDPFHEGCPPEKGHEYLSKVGKSINNLYESFDKDSVWVMQGWTPRPDIIKAVPLGRLLILDLPSDRAVMFDNFYGHEVIAGMLHNFGGKNAMQGQIRRHTANCYKRLKDAGVNVVGTGMFMEGIEQNPVVYDLQFNMLTQDDAIDFETWLKDYILRRYGACDDTLLDAWHIMMNTCYSDTGYNENAVGSTIAARPQLVPKVAGPCCSTRIWYDTSELERALDLMMSVSDKYRNNDGYQYDLTDLMRQVLSNRFHAGTKTFYKAYKRKKIDAMKNIARSQLELLLDVDELLSHRSELCFARYIMNSHRLAISDEERRYFDKNARALVTLWGDIDGECALLYDYAWREWSGLIKEYYYKRWEMFYTDVIEAREHKRRFKEKPLNNYKQRRSFRAYPFGAKLFEFERAFVDDYKEYNYPEDSDVVPCAKKLYQKYMSK